MGPMGGERSGLVACRCTANWLPTWKGATSANGSPVCRKVLFREWIQSRPAYACRQRGRQQLAEGKNDTGAPSPFEHGLPLGNLIAGLAA